MAKKYIFFGGGGSWFLLYLFDFFIFKFLFLPKLFCKDELAKRRQRGICLGLKVTPRGVPGLKRGGGGAKPPYNDNRYEFI